MADTELHDCKTSFVLRTYLFPSMPLYVPGCGIRCSVLSSVLQVGETRFFATFLLDARKDASLAEQVQSVNTSTSPDMGF